jgi:hypothetical protein
MPKWPRNARPASMRYTDDFLARYAPGGVYGVLRELRYPIHIVVKNGRIMLLGVVDNATDRQLAEVRARR